MTATQHPRRIVGSEHRDSGARGTLTISEKAIEKIAGQAAAEVPGIHGTSGGFLGLGSHSDEDARPKVKVQLSGRIAALHISAGVKYPAPLRVTTDRLRQAVKDKVNASCGIEVRQIDIDVQTLVSAATTPGRRDLL
ncbi:Asp23/Gls24 family envelope stress response protein [Arthrobacter sp. 260]|uniref:Asp23/Gls24 family envelope stress response protein n=1 Tax=Arthrobacter sp. 260 TaxID=2735314 RepID=UPI001490BBA9|nr:Asp23/Gls24 family envelope stress response protein [Arthrobacter sp. 260]NOJ59792.1 Asp23/Gls24 family envelope stress response protein [Arthrobacter sp. 260]